MKWAENGITGSRELRIAAEEETADSSYPLARHRVQTAHSKALLSWISILSFLTCRGR